jgi:hypothetical protein
MQQPQEFVSTAITSKKVVLTRHLYSLQSKNKALGNECLVPLNLRVRLVVGSFIGRASLYTAQFILSADLLYY